MEPGSGQGFLVQVQRNVGLELTLLIVLLRQTWGQKHNTEAAPAQRTYTFSSQKVTLSQTAVEFDVH